MNITPQQEQILEIHRDMQYHCSTEYEYIRDHRKRISELNQGYLRKKGYELHGIPCDGRCGKKHSSTLYMRRAQKITTPSEKQEAQRISKRMVELFDAGATPQEILSVS